MNTLIYFFAWPHGQIWPNLIASVIWATPALLHIHRKLNKHHKEIMTRKVKDGAE